MERSSNICTYDFTVATKHILEDVLKDALKSHCKKWCFQEETSDSGYNHYQGRISLKVKSRLPGVIRLFNNPKIHFSVTSNNCKDNIFYVTKDDTRVKGPWADTDVVIYIPRQIREITELYPWQEQVIKMSKKWDTRRIHCIIDSVGNNGKSTLVGYMRAHNLGRKLPFSNDYRDIMRMVMDMPNSNCYIIDMPRAINKEKLYQLWSAIEEIKGGYAYDDRYSFREKTFDCPQIFVFMNTPPDETLLSRDRWKKWYIDEEHSLQKYITEPAIEFLEE